MQELVESGPDPEAVGAQLKRLMNSLYRQLRAQIRPERYYSGNGLLVGLLQLIKMYTARAVQGLAAGAEAEAEGEAFEEHVSQMDLFSVHVYVGEAVPAYGQQQSIEVLSNTFTKVSWQ